MNRKIFLLVPVILNLVCGALLAAPVGSAFTYQGRLNQGGTPANGTYDLTFQLFDSSTAGDAIAAALTNSSINVNNGLFTTKLDFGPGVFDGNSRWLEIAVRTNGGGAFTALSPRQELTPSPYASYANNAGTAGLAQTVAAGAITSMSLAPGAVGASQLASNSITAGQLASGAAAANLAASGQVGVASGGIVLSTGDNSALISAGYTPAGIMTTADRWQQRVVSGPSIVGRASLAAVWTGTEVLFWGGNAATYVNDGIRFSPANNSWKIMSSVGAPTPRAYHTAVWTGTELLVWGGMKTGYLQDGGRYNPATDTWRPISTNGAPIGRRYHTAIWTGTNMIVWGGYGNAQELADGGRYDPVSDTWSLISTNDAPAPRQNHTAVWTGSEMIIWGGVNSLGSGYCVQGHRYNPATDVWTTISTNGSPTGRSGHVAVWTGTEMIVSGTWTNAGGRYNPGSDSWTLLPTEGAPSYNRYGYSGVWSGTEFIIWAGGCTINYTYPPYYSYYSLWDGARYNPTSNTWTPMNLNDAPAGRLYHAAVWAGSEMIVWGGQVNGGGPFDDGGRYNPAMDAWEPMTFLRIPCTRAGHNASWTGSEMIVWGGNRGAGLTAVCTKTGGRYNAVSNIWTGTTCSNAPSPRYNHAAVWTGSELLVWGGNNASTNLFDGGRYNPASNTWRPIATNGAPQSPCFSAVWTGTEMIVPCSGTNMGARYNPSSDLWTSISTNTPSRGYYFSTVWTGTEMIIWGGGTNSGARYNPATDTWKDTSTNGAPTPRSYHSAIWTGTEMIVWGGSGYLNDGGAYNPLTDSWRPMLTNGAPVGRYGHTAVWTGAEMVVWGGHGSTSPYYLNDGGRYDPAANAWAALPAGSASGRFNQTAIWTGNEMLMFGGSYSTNSSNYYLNDTWSLVPARTVTLYMKP